MCAVVVAAVIIVIASLVSQFEVHTEVKNHLEKKKNMWNYHAMAKNQQQKQQKIPSSRVGNAHEQTQPSNSNPLNNNNNKLSNHVSI